MEWLFFLLLILGGGLVRLSRRWSADAGVPGGRIVSVDLERHGRAASVLVDPELNLTGKPDLLMETRRGWVPVEIKSGPASARPHASHVLQLMAYCRLVQAAYGRRPPHGILQYADRGYQLPYTRRVEACLQQRIDRIRARAQELPNRSHNEPARCGACGFRLACNQRLG
jgi:CRISPR-associated exonuclease Cas4